jgi:hypothetical protein
MEDCDGGDAMDEGDDAARQQLAEPPQPQLYSHSAPARFQQYWQPSGAAEAAAAAPAPSAKPLAAPRTASPLLGGPGLVRSYTPLPMAALEAAAQEPAAAPAQEQPQPPLQPAALSANKTFSVGSFSHWLTGSATAPGAAPGAAPGSSAYQQQLPLPVAPVNIIATADAATAAPLGSPPPAPRPLGKRCSSMSSDLWRSAWGSSDDLTALADMAPEEMDTIFSSLGRDTESVLHSVGLELAADGSLRPDASAPGSVAAANNALASHLALSITAA